MPTYISLQKFTDQCVKDIKTIEQRDAEMVERLESIGIKVTGYYLVMGEYDEVVIWEAPSDEVAMTALLALGASGDRRTTTMKAFTNEEFLEMIKKMP